MRPSSMRLATFALVLPTVLAGCAADEGESGGDGTHVEVDDNYFEPEATTIDAGTTLEFENEGLREHTVTVVRGGQDDVKLLDETIGPGEGTPFLFDAAGEYEVYCRFHGALGSGMHMTVTVTAE